MTAKSNCAQTTALLLCVTAQRSGSSRLRISDKSVRIASKRNKPKAAFLVDVQRWTQEYGWTMTELTVGGFGMIRTDALNAAKSFPIESKMKADEIAAPDIEALEKELDLPEREEENE